MTETTLEKTALRPLDVLILEDNPEDAALSLRELKKAGFDAQAEIVQTAHEFCARISAKHFEVILANYTLPDWNGLEALELLQQMDKEIPFILVAGTLSDEAAMRCLQKGVAEFVHKDHLALLPAAVQRVLQGKAWREERGRTDEKLRDYERRCQRLAEMSVDPLFIQSGDKLVYVNAPGAQLLGAEHPQQLVGKPARSIIHPDYWTPTQKRLEKLSGGQEIAYFESRLARLDGKPVDVKVAATVLSYQDQPAIRFVVRDITERKRVEETIASMAAFAELNPNPVLEFSREGKLTYFNEAAGELAKLLGHDHPGGLLPADTAGIVQMCLTTGHIKLGLETSMQGRTFSWSFFPIKPNQVVHCYVEDFTERLSLEAQLRHSQKLESVGRLAAGVAHDFNNIITVIQGHTGLLRSAPNLSPELGESLQQISRASERASKLTSQLLAFSRKNVLQPARLNLNEVLTNISMMLHRTLGEDITFQFGYAPELPEIFADASMIEQIILILAVNARDAMPKGGQLVISTAAVELDALYVERHPEAQVGRFVCLSFIDTGCGMDQVTLSRIFEPFFTTKEFGKGTGLGLATVYGLVKQHEGWIEVQSQLGQGSTFRIYLPPDSRDLNQLTETPADASKTGGHETVLVVEDEPPVRWIVKNILVRAGYRVLEAGSGVEALAVWHQHQNDIALLLTDLVMPVGLSGQELGEKFKAQRANLKVIYTSGYSVEVAGKELHLMDGLNFLQKPFDAARLTKAVRSCLDS